MWFIEAAILVRDLPVTNFHAAHHALLYAYGIGCALYLLSHCVTFTDFFPFSLVPNIRLHADSATP